MRVLVTGGAGRLGSKVVKLIASRGDSAVAFDLPQVSWEAVKGVSGVDVLPGDVTDGKQVSERAAPFTSTTATLRARSRPSE